MQTAMSRLIDVQEVMRLTSLSRATIYRRIERQDDEFPKPVQLAGARRVAWIEEEVHRWIAEQIEATGR